jgi:hypothetical protein
LKGKFYDLRYHNRRTNTLRRNRDDFKDRFAQITQRLLHSGCAGRINDNYNAYAVVEGAVHFDVVDAGGELQPGEQLGLWPAAFGQVGDHGYG